MDIIILFLCFFNLLLIILFIIMASKIRKLSAQSRNKVHFYVAREHDGALRLYMGKPIRCEGIFVSCRGKGGRCLGRDGDLEMYGLNENDYKDLKWEDEPLEVFINMED